MTLAAQCELSEQGSLSLTCGAEQDIGHPEIVASAKPARPRPCPSRRWGGSLSVQPHGIAPIERRHLTTESSSEDYEQGFARWARLCHKPIRYRTGRRHVSVSQCGDLDGRSRHDEPRNLYQRTRRRRPASEELVLCGPDRSEICEVKEEDVRRRTSPGNALAASRAAARFVNICRAWVRASEPATSAPSWSTGNCPDTATSRPTPATAWL